MKSRAALCFAIILSIFTAATAGARQAGTGQEADTSATARLGEQLAALRDSVDRLTHLVESQIETEMLSIAVRRLEIVSDRVSGLERKLETKHQTREILDAERARIAAELDRLAERRNTAAPEVAAAGEERVEDFTRETEAHLESLKQRIGRLDGSILEMENELTRERERLHDLQDLVDREVMAN